jgi:aspartyl-tRNA(Asn)/glutamyl-tRNA(Gln) amidotransferase subunit C
LHEWRPLLLVDKTLVKKIAELAKLNIKESELSLFAEQLSGILEHIKSLESVNVDGIKPMFHGCLEDIPLAADEPEVFDITAITKTTPYIDDKFFCVPSILEEEV